MALAFTYHSDDSKNSKKSSMKVQKVMHFFDLSEWCLTKVVFRGECSIWLVRPKTPPNPNMGQMCIFSNHFGLYFCLTNSIKKLKSIENLHIYAIFRLGGFFGPLKVHFI